MNCTHANFTRRAGAFTRDTCKDCGATRVWRVWLDQYVRVRGEWTPWYEPAPAEGGT